MRCSKSREWFTESLQTGGDLSICPSYLSLDHPCIPPSLSPHRFHVIVQLHLKLRITIPNAILSHSLYLVSTSGFLKSTNYAIALLVTDLKTQLPTFSHLFLYFCSYFYSTLASMWQICLDFGVYLIMQILATNLISPLNSCSCNMFLQSHYFLQDRFLICPGPGFQSLSLL